MLFDTSSILKCWNLSLNGILAGICISIGCIVNLQVGGGVIGAILFTFGLITVVHYKYALYTGTAGFISDWKDIRDTFWFVFLNNVLGCIILGNITRYAMPNIIDNANVIIESRAQIDLGQAFIRAILCGFLMTTAVKFARENKWLPLLFAVPVFILAGFFHSIADAFYIFVSDYSNMLSNIGAKAHQVWGMTIIGNFVGCNLHRIKFLE